MNQIRLKDIIVDHGRSKANWHIGILVFLGIMILFCLTALLMLETV
jgi:hypothetical protein